VPLKAIVILIPSSSTNYNRLRIPRSEVLPLNVENFTVSYNFVIVVIMNVLPSINDRRAS